MKGQTVKSVFSLALLTTLTIGVAVSEDVFAVLPYQDNAPLSIVRDRENYQRALKYLDQGKTREFIQVSNKLKHYPLYPYLLFNQYKDYVAQTSEEEIKTFLLQYAESPIAGELKIRWLHHLANTGNWSAFLRYYTPTQSTSLNCHHTWAEYQTGKKQDALVKMDKIWLTHNDLPAACDEILTVWMLSPYFTAQKVWDRVELAIQKDNFSLARALTNKKLNADDRAIVNLWLSLHQNPQQLHKTAKFIQSPYIKNPHYHRMIRVNLEKLFDDDVDTVIQLWSTYAKALQPNYFEYLKFSERTAKWVSYYHRTDAFEWLEKADPHFQNDELIQRRIRTGLRLGNWARVHEAIHSYPLIKQSESQWLYWHARAQLEMIKESAKKQLQRQPIQRQQPSMIASYRPPVRAEAGVLAPLGVHRKFIALLTQRSLKNSPFTLSSRPQSLNQQTLNVRTTFLALANERSFYGFMASYYLKKPPSLNERKIVATRQDLKKIETIAGIQRARELDAIGYTTASKLEWNQAIKALSPRQRSVAAKLAQNLGWHNQAMLTAAQSDGIDDLSLRFPRPYQNTIIMEANANGVNSDWMMSLIRQESAFNPTAKSPVGALGMMQIMPQTAKELSKKMGYRLKTSNDLLMPGSNVKLGAFYMAEILKRFDDNIVLATAAYNAGPGRVKGWLPVDQAIPGDIWVESIPIKETREYVKNIMTYQVIYQQQMGLKPREAMSLREILPD